MQYCILEQDLCANSWRTCSEYFLCWVSPRTSYYLDWLRRWYVTGFFNFNFNFNFFCLLRSDTFPKGKALFFSPFFSVQGTCTLYVITSRMYSGPRQQNKYYCIDELSCLEGLPYSNLWNAAFDLELAEVLAIIIVIPAMSLFAPYMQHNCINCFCNWSIIFLCIVGTVRIWQANTYRLESTLNYGLERVWSMAMLKGSNNVALGYDEGSILIKVCWLKLLLLFSCIHFYVNLPLSWTNCNQRW